MHVIEDEAIGSLKKTVNCRVAVVLVVSEIPQHGIANVSEQRYTRA